MQHGGQHFGGLHPIHLVISPTGDNPGQVMVIEEQAVPSFSMEAVLPAGHAALQIRQVQLLQIPLFFPRLLVQADVLKLEHHRQLGTIRGTVQLGPLHIRAPGLAHGDQPRLGEGVGGQLPQEFMELGSVAGDLQIRVLADLVDHIQPEALHALVHPEADGFVKLGAHGGILPVQVRLLRGKLMEIVLPQLRNIGPGRAAEDGAHLIGGRAAVAVLPEEIIMVGIVPALFGLQEPGMLAGAVVQHQIQDDGNAPLFRFGNQGVHVLHGAEDGVNGAVIGDVVAVVHLGRGAHRGHPDAVDAQLLQIVQPGDDAPQIAGTAAGGILKALGVNLIEHRRLPPAPAGFVQ